MRVTTLACYNLGRILVVAIEMNLGDVPWSFSGVGKYKIRSNPFNCESSDDGSLETLFHPTPS